jgi:hypothetical protein
MNLAPIGVVVVVILIVFAWFGLRARNARIARRVGLTRLDQQEPPTGLRAVLDRSIGMYLVRRLAARPARAITTAVTSSDPSVPPGPRERLLRDSGYALLGLIALALLASAILPFGSPGHPPTATDPALHPAQATPTSDAAISTAIPGSSPIGTPRGSVAAETFGRDQTARATAAAKPPATPGRTPRHPTPAPTGGPTPTATPTPSEGPTPTPTVSPAPTPTPTASPTPTPGPTPTPSPTPTPEPTPTPDPTPTPVATVLDPPGRGPRA